MALMQPRKERTMTDRLIPSSKATLLNLAESGQTPDEAPSGGCPTPGAPLCPRSSVSVSISKDDPTIITAVIDRTAPQAQIVENLKEQLAAAGVPYRPVDPRIFQAVMLCERDGVSLREASIRLFGTPDMEDRIRYWRNSWGR